MSACNCIGPPGRCPCVMASRNIPTPLVDYFTMLPLEDYSLKACVEEEQKSYKEVWNGPKC